MYELLVCAHTYKHRAYMLAIVVGVVWRLRWRWWWWYNGCVVGRSLGVAAFQWNERKTFQSSQYPSSSNNNHTDVDDDVDARHDDDNNDDDYDDGDNNNAHTD